MISLVFLMAIVMPPLSPHPLIVSQYGFNSAIMDAKTGYNAVDACTRYNSTADFNLCAHGYFAGYLTVCNGTLYGCETHTLPELAENGIVVK